MIGIILFLVFGFSFIALQVTTEDAEAAPEVCVPNERHRSFKDTARHSDYMLWVKRCKVSGGKGQCGNRSVNWPAGDGGRCETIAADTVAAQTGMAPGMPPTAAAPGMTNSSAELEEAKARIVKLEGQLSACHSGR